MTVSHNDLLNSSIQASLAAIEIYNKPDFKYREQSFTVLNINSWELLLKAKILKDNNENINSLYILKPDGSHKTNRSGNPMTIEIIGAIKKISSLDKSVKENLKSLIEIRDTAVHFFHEKDLSYAIYVLAVASLRNYQKLVNKWFDQSLLNYNFNILPLAFSYSFQTFSTIDIENRPEAIANLLRNLNRIHNEQQIESDYNFLCDVEIHLSSAKKLTDKTDFEVSIDNSKKNTVAFAERLQRLLNKYPLQYQDLWKNVKSQKPSIKQNEMNQIIKNLKIKGNPKYSSYSFLYPKDLEKYEKDKVVSGSNCCLYNEDAVRLILENTKD